MFKMFSSYVKPLYNINIKYNRIRINLSSVVNLKISNKYFSRTEPCGGNSSPSPSSNFLFRDGNKQVNPGQPCGGGDVADVLLSLKHAVVHPHQEQQSLYHHPQVSFH